MAGYDDAPLPWSSGIRWPLGSRRIQVPLFWANVDDLLRAAVIAGGVGPVDAVQLRQLEFQMGRRGVTAMRFLVEHLGVRVLLQPISTGVGDLGALNVHRRQFRQARYCVKGAVGNGVLGKAQNFQLF